MRNRIYFSIAFVHCFFSYLYFIVLCKSLFHLSRQPEQETPGVLNVSVDEIIPRNTLYLFRSTHTILYLYGYFIYDAFLYNILRHVESNQRSYLPEIIDLPTNK